MTLVLMAEYSACWKRRRSDGTTRDHFLSDRFRRQPGGGFPRGIAVGCSRQSGANLGIASDAADRAGQVLEELGGSGLWEVRIEYAGDINRILAAFAKGNRVILLHGFQKKSQKTPRSRRCRGAATGGASDDPRRTRQAAPGKGAGHRLGRGGDASRVSGVAGISSKFPHERGDAEDAARAGDSSIGRADSAASSSIGVCLILLVRADMHLGFHWT